MWIKAQDGRLYDATGCSFGPDKEWNALTLTPLSGKPVLIVNLAGRAVLEPLLERFVVAVVERRSLVDLT